MWNKMHSQNLSSLGVFNSLFFLMSSGGDAGLRLSQDQRSGNSLRKFSCYFHTKNYGTRWRLHSIPWGLCMASGYKIMRVSSLIHHQFSQTGTTGSSCWVSTEDVQAIYHCPLNMCYTSEEATGHPTTTITQYLYHNITTFSLEH